MPDSALKILILGAHPDDADYHAGGLAALYASAGHRVKMVSVTDGRSGHHVQSGDTLVAIRRAEAAAAGAVIGAAYEVWDFPDGRLEPTIALREHLIAAIRREQPDLVLTHRPNDYHPDHRAVGQAVQDASYLVTVPPIVPEVPPLRRDAVVAYMPDTFTKPTPLEAHVIVDMDAQFDVTVEMLSKHGSQFFEWLPYNEGIVDQVPDGESARLDWLKGWYHDKIAGFADRYRDRLIETYGPRRGAEIRYAVPLEISEYAGAFGDAERRRLFPFLP